MSRQQHLTQDQVSERHDHAGQPASRAATGNAQNRKSTPETLFSSGAGKLGCYRQDSRHVLCVCASAMHRKQIPDESGPESRSVARNVTGTTLFDVSGWLVYVSGHRLMGVTSRRPGGSLPGGASGFEDYRSGKSRQGGCLSPAGGVRAERGGHGQQHVTDGLLLELMRRISSSPVGYSK
jgi:hypothetical protein